MLTKNDLKWLKENLATKEDLKNLENRLDGKFTKLFDFIDKEVMNHKKRLVTIEDILKISSYA